MGYSDLEELTPGAVHFDLCLPCRGARDSEWRTETGAAAKPAFNRKEINDLLWVAFIGGLVIGAVVGSCLWSLTTV
jgi:hypothetical protein